MTDAETISTLTQLAATAASGAAQEVASDMAWKTLEAAAVIIAAWGGIARWLYSQLTRRQDEMEERVKSDIAEVHNLVNGGLREKFGGMDQRIKTLADVVASRPCMREPEARGDPVESEP